MERFARGKPVQAIPLSPPLRLSMWARRRPAVASLLGSLVLAFVVGFAGVAWPWRRAEQAGDKLEKSLHHLAWREIIREAESEPAPPALARLAKPLRSDPDKWQVTMRVMSIVSQHAFPVLAGPMVTRPSPSVLPPWLAGSRWPMVCRRDRRSQYQPLGHGNGSRILADSHGFPPSPLSPPVPARWRWPWATADGRIRITRSPGEEWEEVLHLEAGPARSQQLSSGGAHPAAVTATSIMLWKSGSPATAARVVTLEGGVTGAIISASGSHLFAWNQHLARVWDMDSGAPVLTAHALSGFIKGALSEDGGVISLIDGEFSARSRGSISVIA